MLAFQEIFQLFIFNFSKVHVPARLDKSVGNTIPGEDKKGLIGYSAEMMKETWQVYRNSHFDIPKSKNYYHFYLTFTSDCAS